MLSDRLNCFKVKIFPTKQNQIEQINGISFGMIQIAIDKVHGVIDFMGHTRHQLAQARHLLLLDQLSLRVAQFANGFF